MVNSLKVLAPLLIAAALVAQDNPRMRIPLVEEKTSQTYLHGELLYWLPEMDGLKYVVEHPSAKQPATPHEIKGNWAPGFRAAIGHIFDEKGWDIAFSWTHFHNTPTDTFSGQGTPVMTTLPYSKMNQASGKWHLIQNIADFEVGRRVPVGEQFFARGIIGLRDAIFHNKTHFRYAHDDGSTRKIAAKSKYWGLGPRIGGSAAYEFGYGIGIFALGSGSLLMGDFNSTFNRRFVKSNPWVRIVTTLQIETGLQWKKTFRDRYPAAFRLAWEQNFYNGVNPSTSQLERTHADKKTVPLYQDEGDLLVKGWTASCQMNY